MLAEAPQVVFETDSISAAFILEKDNAKSPLMQIAFHLLQQTQEWVALIVDAGERERTARHVKGKINIFADAESRGYHNLISDLCMQLGIKRRGMELTDAAQAYLAAFAKDASPLVPLPLQGLDVSPACNLHDGPPTITKKWKTPRARDRPRCRCPYGDCHCHRETNGYCWHCDGVACRRRHRCRCRCDFRCLGTDEELFNLNQSDSDSDSSTDSDPQIGSSSSSPLNQETIQFYDASVDNPDGAAEVTVQLRQERLPAPAQLGSRWLRLLDATQQEELQRLEEREQLRWAQRESQREEQEAQRLVESTEAQEQYDLAYALAESSRGDFADEVDDIDSAVQRLRCLQLRGAGADGPTLQGFLDSTEVPSPPRPSTASRTLALSSQPPVAQGWLQVVAQAAERTRQQATVAPPPVPVMDGNIYDHAVLHHLQRAITDIRQAGVPPLHPELATLMSIGDSLQQRLSAILPQPASSSSRGETMSAHPFVHVAPGVTQGMPLRLASADYALTGTQVAAGHSNPHPQQPNAVGYPVGSRYALNPPQHVWDEFLLRRAAAMEKSFPIGTRNSNDCHWRFWIAHCARWGCVTPIRDNYDAMSGRDPLGQRAELDLAASYIDARYLTMQPRKKGTIPKVESAFQSYLAVVRIQGGRSIPQLPMAELRRLVKGMNNNIIEEFGVEVVLPCRKQPISNELHRQLLSQIQEGTKLGPFLYNRDSHFGRSWRRLLGILNRSGLRKAEWSARSKGGRTAFTFRQVAYCFGDDPTPHKRPTRAQLREPGVVWLYVYPTASKTDPDGRKFCTKAIPYKRTADPNDVVELFLMEELRMIEQGITDEQRLQVPLFSAESGEAFHRSALDAALLDALLLFVPRHVATHISWHSYRIRLACQLRAAGFDNPTIQAMVRWSSDEAVAIYARFEREEYWSKLQRAASLDTTSVQFTALPEVDEMQRFIECSGMTDKPWSAIEKHVLELAPDEDKALLREATAVAESPVATAVTAGLVPAMCPAQSPGPRQPRRMPKAAQPRLPPAGWVRREVTLNSGRVIPHYDGPGGASARSCVEAHRIDAQRVASFAGSSSPPQASPAPSGPGIPPPAAPPLEPAPTVAGGAVSSRRGRSDTVAVGDTATIRESDDHELARGTSRHTVSEAARPARTQQASRPIPPPVRSAHALPAHEFALVRGRCGTYGCLLQDHHLGPCTPQLPASSLRSRSTTR